MSTNSRRNQNIFINKGFPLLIFLAVLALILTFSISVSENTFILKLGSFVAITIVYLVIAAVIYKARTKDATIIPREITEERQNTETKEHSQKTFSGEIEEKLLALEEANAIFSSSLKPADMFRLISNRINEIIPFSLSALYLTTADREKLKISYSFGHNSAALTGIEIEADSGVAGKTFQSGEIQTDVELLTEKTTFPLDSLENLKSGIACPLIYEDDNYGVLALYNSEENYGEDSKPLLNAISARISPLFISSIAFENNLNSALNDSLTNLPNERALFMMLENQVAESQRFREQRPLTVLSLDIKDFAKLNNTYGHATGDRILSFVARNIKEQLRQMDFLSRLAGDEFLAVLPTSSDKTTEMIVERIKNAFASNPFAVTPQDKVFIELNFGQASFVKDGETAQDLMKIASIKKRESKSTIKSTVLWFPKEYSN
jgi:diguanylate cyclase (GGDEF)-like protein